jgi:uncharacterized protein (DUF488 family)
MGGAHPALGGGGRRADAVRLNKDVATIGFAGKGAERFVQLLTEAGVETVVDTRRRPDSPLAAYARQRDLPYFLSALVGIRYEHRPELAPSNELLDRYRKDKDWDAYVRDFEDVLRSDEGVSAMRELLTREDRVVLLCSEATPEKCHRRLVAERMKEMSPDLVITHLT